MHPATPLMGWCADRFGIEYVTVICLLLAVPWWIVLIIKGPVALFIVAFATESRHHL